MKSSRQRFAEFRSKMRRGLLDPDKLKSPDDKRDEIPNIGGHHKGGSGGKHTFKFSKRYILSEYVQVIKGYYAPLFVLLAVTLGNALVAAVSPIVLKLLIDYVVKEPQKIHFITGVSDATKTAR